MTVSEYRRHSSLFQSIFGRPTTSGGPCLDSKNIDDIPTQSRSISISLTIPLLCAWLTVWNSALYKPPPWLCFSTQCQGESLTKQWMCGCVEMDNPWQLCRPIGPLTLYSQEIYSPRSIKLNKQWLQASLKHVIIILLMFTYICTYIFFINSPSRVLSVRNCPTISTSPKIGNSLQRGSNGSKGYFILSVHVLSRWH